MPENRPRGTEGYADEADALVRQYESLSFAEVHRHVLHLLPQPPAMPRALSDQPSAASAPPTHRRIRSNDGIRVGTDRHPQTR